jgi:predicted NBD/HSP70 family sugar kinase
LEALIGSTRAREKAALATFEDCVHYLARGLATLTSVLNPERFVLGGPVAAFFAQNPERIKAKIRENLLPNHPIPDLFFSPLGSDGPAVGAGCLMHRGFLAMDRALVFDAR